MTINAVLRVTTLQLDVRLGQLWSKSFRQGNATLTLKMVTVCEREGGGKERERGCRGVGKERRRKSVHVDEGRKEDEMERV